MRIFVGYSFKDKWVEDYVILLIETYRAEVVDGKELPGERIDECIKKKIEESRAAVIFLSRCKPLQAAGKFQPSDWLVQELTQAAGKLSRWRPRRSQRKVLLCEVRLPPNHMAT